MHPDTEQLKRGVNYAAGCLMDAVDRVAFTTSDSRAKFRRNACAAALRTGDQLIQQGHRLKPAANVRRGAR
jgi:hypothetical protein